MTQTILFGSDSVVKKDAEISFCGRFRYWLSRHWEPGERALPIIMLNPSTADSSNDDPTIRRCMSFARREDFGGIRVVNLFAFRATSPDDMKAAPDPFGPEGSNSINNVLAAAKLLDIPVLAAWGAHGGHLDRAASVITSAKGYGVRLLCLGTTAAGHPRHPLYVKGDQPLVSFA